MSRQMLNEHTFTAGPTATIPARVETMTLNGTIVRSLLLVVVTAVFAAIGWSNAGRVFELTSGVMFLVGYFLLIALCLAAAANPRLAAVTGFVYAVLMGLWMGAISKVYESFYDGIVGQAALVSLCVFVACLLLYTTRTVRVTGRFVKIVIGATLGIALLYFVGFIFSLFGVDLLFWTQPTPLGIGVSLIICLIAASNLFLDFAFIERGIEARAPASMEWYSAFGLLSTLVWLYLEILRFLALLRAQQ